ncbi:MAG: HAMP domain-containing histidine kinase [Oscillospiraceae bacterium]|nr:HAMP domain-containing histidine kinase [Oscillospiraceae bacterium]
MKFAWKVTLATLCILLLSTGLGSYLLISLSFQSALEREIAMAQEEMQLLRVSYEAVCNARGVTLENIAERSRGLTRTLEEAAYLSDHQFRVVTEAGERIYSTLASASDRELLERIDLRSSGYVLRLDQSTGQHLLHCAGPVVLPDGVLYMETVRDMSRLFADRETHYQVYRWIVLLVVGVSSAVMFALSYWLTAPIRSLGRAADQLARGDYSTRARVMGGDEIGELAENFNHMADAIGKNIQELEDAARRQEDFTASFVHELKTPLTSIIGYADMLRSRNLREEMRFKAASYIFSEGKRLENLSLSLMSLQVVGRSEAEARMVNMRKLCAEAARICQPAMKAKGLTLTARAEEGMLRGDGALLQTLLQNLLDNARKATGSGGRVVLVGRSMEEGYQITVADQGRGIPEGELGKITEPFYMVDKSRSRAEGGAGLGLALCKQIVELHRGQLRFESKEGTGTIVTVTLGGVANGE